MGRKSYISYEKKVEAVEKYLRGEGSQESIAREYGIATSGFRQWLANYEAMGPSSLAATHKNNRYSVELKTAAVEAYLQGQGSIFEISKRFGVRSKTQLRDWIKLYNGHKDFRATGGRGRGIYMTKGRKTMLDERIEIVSYCIANGKNYAAAIERYNVSYSQIYSWVRRYELEGPDGLIDKRGKRKPEDKMTEEELLHAHVKMLNAEIKHKDMEIAVLKKLREIERRRR